MYGARDRLQGAATQQSSATTLSSYSYTSGVGRVGTRLPAFQRSRFTHSTRLSSQHIRVLQFGNKEQPRLLRSQWTTEGIRLYMEYIIRIVRAEAYDTTVMEASMDEESIMYLQTLFRTTKVAANNPICIYWTEDCDVATILDALDELFPLDAVGYRWEAVVTESHSNVEIPQGDMEQERQNTLIKWNRALINLGPEPDNNRLKISEGLVGRFTHRDNLHRA